MREHFYSYPHVVELPNGRVRSESAPSPAPRVGLAPMPALAALAAGHSGAQTHVGPPEAR